MNRFQNSRRSPVEFDIYIYIYLYLYIYIYIHIYSKLFWSISKSPQRFLKTPNISKTLRHAIPEWSHVDHKWAHTPLRGTSRRRGVYLVIEGLYLITSYRNRQASYQLRPNIGEESDVQGPHYIPCNLFFSSTAGGRGGLQVQMGYPWGPHINFLHKQG